MSFFSFTKMEDRRSEQVLSKRIGTSGRRKKVGKWCMGVSIVQKLCKYVCKWKDETC
jgi:hypothetical protein